MRLPANLDASVAPAPGCSSPVTRTCPKAVRDVFMDANDISFVPMTNVEGRAADSLAAEPIRYAFALLNRGCVNVVA